MQTHIYLIGLMGAGKTTIGRQLARLTGREFIDTDQALEARTGVSVSHIFEIEGEAGFRAREAKLLAEIGAGKNGGDGKNGRGKNGDGKNGGDKIPGAVVATGGGIVLREDNRRVLRESGVVVYLRASLELLRARLRGCDTRPLLSAPDPSAKIAQLLDARGPLYAAEADYIFDVGGEPAARAAQRLHELLHGDARDNHGRR